MTADAASPARAPLRDRLSARALGAVMALELAHLATGERWSGHAAEAGVVAVAALAAHRFGLREGYLMVLCGSLAALALSTRDDAAALLLTGLDQAAFLMAFIPLIGLIEQAARTAPAVREAGLYLIRQPPGRRWIALAAGTHAMAQLFNIGMVSLLTPLVMRGAEGDADPRLAEIRRRRGLSALLRGFSWAVVWSPTAVAPLVLSTLLPEAQRGPWIAAGFAISMLALALGWAEDRWRFRHARAQLGLGAPSAPPAFPAAAYAELALICLILLGLVLIFMALTGGSVVFGLMASAPLILLGWVLRQSGGLGAPARRRTAARLRQIGGGWLPTVAPLAVTLAASGFVGRVGAALAPVEAWAAALGLASMPGWLFLWGLTMGVTLLSQFALSPIMMAVFFGALIAELPILPADVTWAALAISCGWAMAMLASPFATVVLMAMPMTGYSGRAMTWTWNAVYAPLCAAMLAAAYALLEGLG
ncbi:MAG: hypothetical protein AAF192_14395 [Pseudomonadota bacterium]